jgi:O-antigen biosynthesis protein
VDQAAVNASPRAHSASQLTRRLIDAFQFIGWTRTPLRWLTAEGPTPPSGLAWTPLTLRRRTHYALSAAARSRIEWRAYALHGSQVRVWYAAPGAAPGSAIVSLQSQGSGGDAEVRLALSRPSEWQELRLTLPSSGGGEVRITLHSDNPSVVWGDPMLGSRRPLRSVIVTGLAAMRLLGARGVARRARVLAQQAADDERYREWREWQRAKPATTENITGPTAGVRSRGGPKFSIVMPVYNTDSLWLRRSVESVRRQTYTNWELCLHDDGSSNADTRATLASFSGDARILISGAERNAGISHATNQALRMASGEFVGFLDHDDEVEPTALEEIARCLSVDPSLDVVYTDEDKIDPSGVHSQPHFKPDWSPERLLSCMYVSHLTVMRRRLVIDVGGLRSEFDGAQDYDLMLRVAERTSRIAHVPRVLYSWRSTPASAADSQLVKPWAVDAGRRALEDHLRRTLVDATVAPTEAAGHYRVRFRITGQPKISVVRVIAATEQPYALDRWLSGWDHEIIDVTYAEADLPAQLNRAVARSRGDHLLFLNGVEPFEEKWVEALLELSQRSAMGAVGGFLLDADERIVEAGVVLGAGGLVAGAFAGEPSWTHGHRANALDIRDCSAVSAACLMTRRTMFDRLGGFDERFRNRLYDVDYCLRLPAHEGRVAVTPHARVRVRGRRDAEPCAHDIATLRATWGTRLDSDPYYNRNFDRTEGTFRLPARAGPGLASPIH